MKSRTWMQMVLVLAVLSSSLLACGESKPTETPILSMEQVSYIDQSGSQLPQDQFETQSARIGTLDFMFTFDETGERLPAVVALNQGELPESLVVGTNEEYQIAKLDRVTTDLNLSAHSALATGLTLDRLAEYVAEKHPENSCILFAYDVRGGGPTYSVYDIGVSGALLVVETSLVARIDGPAMGRSHDAVNGTDVSGALLVGGMSQLARIDGLAMGLRQDDANEASYEFIMLLYDTVEAIHTPLLWLFTKLLTPAAGLRLESLQNALSAEEDCEPSDPNVGCVDVTVEDESGEAIEDATVTLYFQVEHLPYDIPYARTSDSNGAVTFGVLERLSDDVPEFSYYLQVDGGPDYEEWDGSSSPFQGPGVMRVEQVITLVEADSDGEGEELPADGLVAFYPFNGNASDESGSENHGTVHGATFTSGRIGQGASFDGADDYIQITNPVDTPLGDRDYTIAFWAKADQWEGKNRHMVAIGDVTTQKGDVSVAYHYSGWAGGGRPVGIYIVHFGADWSTGVEVQPGRWYHFSATYDGATERFYMDGVLQASGGYGGFNIDSSPIIIGAQAWDGLPADEFDGVIDEVRIYNRALTGEEIQALYEYR